MRKVAVDESEEEGRGTAAPVDKEAIDEVFEPPPPVAPRMGGRESEGASASHRGLSFAIKVQHRRDLTV